MLRLGQQLEDFEIRRLLGRGGMGEVYEAEQREPRRLVALKVLSPWLAHDAEALERFRREAGVPARLDHPSNVRIYSIGRTDDGIAYFTMQLVRGVSLADLIRRTAASGDALAQPSTAELPETSPSQRTVTQTPASGSPNGHLAPAAMIEAGDAPPEVVKEYLHNRFQLVARVGSQAARALDHAHRQGFLHRDIKPSNLMIDQHHHLYLVDFGLTRALAPDAKGTQPGLVRGTPWYMSPELARGEVIDHRSDIFSLGVTLYELATGGLGPYTASRHDSDRVIEQVREGRFEPIRSYDPTVPLKLERIIAKAMHPDREQRYHSAGELAQELDSCRDSKLTLPFLAPTEVAAPASPKRRRAGLIVAGVAAVILLASPAGFTAYYNRDKGGDSKVSAGTQPAEAKGLLAMASVDSQGSGPPVAATELTPGKKPYPDVLRRRPVNIAMSLIDAGLEPLYIDRVGGTGRYTTYLHRQELAVDSPLRDYATYMALDDDPERRWFEFAIDLRAMQIKEEGLPGKHEVGVFFGWRLRDPADPGRSMPFFEVLLDERPDPKAGFPNGRVEVRRTRVMDHNELRRSPTPWPAPLKSVKPTIPLKSLGGWKHVIVRAYRDHVAVRVEGHGEIEFDMALVRREGDQEVGDFLDARGALGVWARDGTGFFRKATIMSLGTAGGKE